MYEEGEYSKNLKQIRQNLQSMQSDDIETVMNNFRDTKQRIERNRAILDAALAEFELGSDAGTPPPASVQPLREKG